MLEQELTAFHRARLEAQTERAAEAVRSASAHAAETMANAPRSDPDDPEMRLYHMAGRSSANFLLWFLILMPLVLLVAG